MVFEFQCFLWREEAALGGSVSFGIYALSSEGNAVLPKLSGIRLRLRRTQRRLSRSVGVTGAYPNSLAACGRHQGDFSSYTSSVSAVSRAEQHRGGDIRHLRTQCQL